MMQAKTSAASDSKSATLHDAQNQKPLVAMSDTFISTLATRADLSEAAKKATPPVYPGGSSESG